jgi:hypothetical protein
MAAANVPLSARRDRDARGTWFTILSADTIPQEKGDPITRLRFTRSG